MKKLRKAQSDKVRSPNLIPRVFALFFVAVSLVSLTNLFVFSRLLNTLENEANALNKEQLNTAAIKLDAVLSKVHSRFAELVVDSSSKNNAFTTYTGMNPTQYVLHKMYYEAQNTFNNDTYIDEWVIFLWEHDIAISSTGITTLEKYITEHCSSMEYDFSFWERKMSERFSREFYPEAEFCIQPYLNTEYRRMLPTAMKSYWKNDLMVVFFLDVSKIGLEVGSYMEAGSYLFAEDGTLLYHSDEDPLITTLPTETRIKDQDASYFVFRTVCDKTGLEYVKLIPQTQAMGMVRSSQKLFLVVTLLSLAVASALILLSVRRTLHPINGMLDLLQQHSDGKRSGDIREARSILEEVLQQREEQAQTLAKQDALLSEYALRAQLKSLYVDAKQNISPNDGAVYILYIQVQYRERVSSQIQTPRAEMESLLQDVLSAELNRQFMSCLMFQLEPGCFVAKVMLEKNAQMEDRMRCFLKRLEQEREFAYFTVVQSRPLLPGEDLAEIYAAVLQGARQARVCEQTQWLSVEALPQEKEILFSKQEEQRLAACVHARQLDAAAEQVQEILQSNLHQGVSYVQMEILCVALVNTVTYALSELLPGTERITAVSGVYNSLATRCKTAKDYCDTVLQFIRSCEESNPEPRERDILLKKVQQYLESNYYWEFSGEEMAEALKVSRSYLSTYYKSKTGMNLSDSIQLYRIQKAMELMKDPDIKISEVGTMVGISSGNTFLRQFKKYTGMSPKDYRSKIRE